MTLTREQLTIHTFGPQWQRVSLRPEDELQIYADLDDISAEVTGPLSDLIVEKDEEFLAAEDRARMFWESLGFTALQEIVLVQDGKALQEVFELETVLAAAGAWGPIVVHNQRIREYQSLAGSDDATGSTLAHELAHVTYGIPTDLTFRDTTDEAGEMYYREGFNFADSLSPRGLFYEEAFASLLTAWYIRSQQNSLADPIAKTQPSLSLPVHFMPYNPAMISGPDGHTMEMLANAAEVGGISTRSQFMAMLLETRRPQTRVSAFREFAQTIDAIKPGLYTQLQCIPYDKKHVLEARALVHEIVTI